MICSLKSKKDVVILKRLLWILCCWFLKPCPIQVVISLPLWIKLPMSQLLLFFLCNFNSLFSFVGRMLVTSHFSLLLIDRYIFGYSANYNTRRVFAILFLICSGLLNCLRSLGIMVITTESG